MTSEIGSALVCQSITSLSLLARRTAATVAASRGVLAGGFSEDSGCDSNGIRDETPHSGNFEFLHWECAGLPVFSPQ